MASLLYYLDRRRSLRDGRYPLRLRVSVHSVGAYINMDIKLRETEWDSVRQQVRGVANRNVINSFLRNYMVQMENALLELRMKGMTKGRSANEVKELLLAAVSGGEAKRYNLVEQYGLFVSTRSNSTRKMYESSLAALRKYEHRLDGFCLEDDSSVGEEGDEPDGGGWVVA